MTRGSHPNTKRTRPTTAIFLDRLKLVGGRDHAFVPFAALKARDTAASTGMR